MAKHSGKGEGNPKQGRGKHRGDTTAKGMIKDNPYKASAINRAVQAIADAAMDRTKKKMHGGK